VNKAVVILPTYNEVENISVILDKLIKLPCKLDILIIDDNSQDGTIDVVKNFMKTYDNISLIVRVNEKGLGTALKRGYKEAYERGYNIAIQMDADLQHPPEIIPNLISLIENGYDVVIASRYIEGGGVSSWSLYRRVVSRFANLYAKIILGLRTKDVTSGFRAFSRKALAFLYDLNLRSKGFMIQVETLYNLERNGFKVIEYPFIFRERIKGSSKLKIRVILEFFLNIPLLRFRGTRF